VFPSRSSTVSESWDDFPPDATTRWGWDDANTTADRPSRPRLRAVSALEAMQEPAPIEVVEGVAWAGCITVLVAESSAGKTFVALDLAAAISAGFSWHGRAVTQGTVVHIGYEGDAIGLRLRALHEHRHARLEHVYRVKAAAPLSPNITRDGETSGIGELDVLDALRTLAHDLETEGRPAIVLVIVDTVRASLHGSEDSSDSVSAYLRAIRRLLEAIPPAAGLLVHHAGWQDGDAAKKRERGSSALRGNVDATLYLEAGDYVHETESAPLTLTTHKVRDGERQAPLHFIRQRVTFPDLDAHGKPLTSCVIDPDPRSASDHAADRAAKATAAQQVEDLRLLRLLLVQSDTMTSVERIRAALRIKKDAADATIARLTVCGWIAPPAKQRAPYTITLAGRTTLNGSGPTHDAD
jgi:hypothetical protein